MAKNHGAKKRLGPKDSYHIPFACFTCRKTFKHPYVPEKWIGVCSVCKGETFNMGRKFRSPAKEDAAKWKVIEYITRTNKWSYFRGAKEKQIPFPKMLKEAMDFVSRIDEVNLEKEMRTREQVLKSILDRGERKKRAKRGRKLPIPGKLKK